MTVQIFRFTGSDANLCESELERLLLAELMFCPFGYHTGPHIIHGIEEDMEARGIFNRTPLPLKKKTWEKIT